MNYSRFLTHTAANRKPSIIRSLLWALYEPNLIYLAGGLPNPECFPFKEATVVLKDGTEIELDPQIMNTVLQYGPTPGYPPLIKQLKELTQKLHSPPRWSETELIVTTGSQDGLARAIEMMIYPNDYVLIQTPAYSGTISILDPYMPRYLPVTGDSLGMDPECLQGMLSKWTPEEASQSEDVPKFLYVNPNACNPTGVSFSTERRKRIYEIACRYNLIILEDDPYYFLQFEDFEKVSPSFLSLDTEGRVLRFDSFSKILSAGLRLGFVVGPKPLITAIEYHMQASVLHTSGLAQALVSKLLEKWGTEGLLKHASEVQNFYRSQRDIMVEAANRHLSGLCEFAVPTGGMFLWLKVSKVTETWDLILKKGPKKGVMLVPGKPFFPVPDDKGCNYMRASFSLATREKIDQGMKNLAELIKEELSGVGN